MLWSDHSVSTSLGTVALRDTQGQGLPIVLLHGAGFDARVFARQFDSPLAREWRLIAPDLPGHGRTALCPGHRYRLPDIADMVAQILDSLSIGRAILLGWSLGGHIGIEMMSRHPARLAGVMVCGTPPLGRGPLAGLRAFHMNRNLLLFSKRSFSRPEAEHFARLCFGDQAEPHHIEAILQSSQDLSVALRQDLLRGVGADQKAVVASAKLPLAIVNGSDDPVVRPSYFASLDYGNLWEARCHEIANAGHGAFYTAPHAFNALLHRFAMDTEIEARRRTSTEHKARYCIP